MNALRRFVLATGIAAGGLLMMPAATALAGDDKDADAAFGGGRYGAAPIGEEVTPAETGKTSDDLEPMDDDEANPRQNLQPRTDLTTEEAPAPIAKPTTIRPQPAARRPMLPFGMALSVGGGVQDFVDDDAEAMTDAAGTYDARVLLGTRSPIGLEAAYIGSAGNIQALGLDQDALLVSNGVEGLVRVNLGRTGIQPFVFGGAAWQRYNLANEGSNTSSLSGEDDVLALPVGGGISSYVGTGGLMLDARFTYRPTFREDLLPAMSEAREDLDSWNVSARIGYEF